MTPPSRSTLLRQKARQFSEAFIHGSLSPHELLSQFMTSTPQIVEHGSQEAQKRLPFVGTLFTGRRSSTSPPKSTCDDYFDLLGATLALHSHEKSLPEENGYVVDPEALFPDVEGKGVVLVKAHARLSSVGSGRSWEEHFVFLLSGFDGEGRIGKLEIWADNLSAWEAVGE